MNKPPFAARLLLLLLLLLAFSLRFYRIEVQSFWNDEGNSARLAERTPGLILAGAASDIHPPGYYLLLHYWQALAGRSELALRALSAMAGVLLVAFTYLLGRALFNRTCGLLAAFLATLSPLGVYYSQEARMYALLGALSAASTYLLLRFLAGRREPSQVARAMWKQPALAAAYVFAAAAGLYTQYAFAFILLVHNAVFGLWWTLRTSRRWRDLAVWAVIQAAILALYLPWLPTALRATRWPSAETTVGLGWALADIWRVLTVGVTLPLDKARSALVGAGALALLGLWPRREGRVTWFETASVALYLALPIALILGLDLYKPAWLKFLLVALAPFHVLLAQGMANCRRLVAGLVRRPATHVLGWLIPAALATLAAAATAPSLHNLYFDPAYFRADYRQIAADIIAARRPGDGVILNAPNQWEVFTYYYPDQNVHPAPYHPTADQVSAFLDPLLARYDRLFVLYWGDAESDPARQVEASLAARAYPADSRWYGDVRVETYSAAATAEHPVITLNARFGDAILLSGYTITDTAFDSGAIAPVTLFWKAQSPPASRYKVTVQLLDEAGKLVAQHDAEPVAGFAPTDAWQRGQIVVDRHGIPLPATLAPGRYTLIAAMYHVATGERLPATLDGAAIGDHLTLGEIVIR